MDDPFESCLTPLFNWLHGLGLIDDHSRHKYAQLNYPLHKFFDELRTGVLLSKVAMVAVPQRAQSYRNDVSIDAQTRYHISNLLNIPTLHCLQFKMQYAECVVFFSSVERKMNIGIFISACAQLNIRPLLKVETVERMAAKDWETILDILQSMSKRMEKLFPGEIEGNAFELDKSSVKALIEGAQNPNAADMASTDTAYELYKSPYRKTATLRVSDMLEVIACHNMVLLCSYIVLLLACLHHITISLFSPKGSK